MNVESLSNNSFFLSKSLGFPNVSKSEINNTTIVNLIFVNDWYCFRFVVLRIKIQLGLLLMYKFVMVSGEMFVKMNNFY